MMARVLVTGASGLIGRACLPILEPHFEVHTLSSRPQLNAAVNWHTVNLLDSAQVSAIIRQVRPTHLLHLAWITKHPVYWHSADNIRWVQASLHLLDEFASCGGQRIVTTGTGAEYDAAYSSSVEEKTPLRPTTTYGQSKYALSLLQREFAAQTGLSAAWARIFWVYGAHENPQRLIPHLIQSLLRHEAALCTSGIQIRDLLYVQDAASALVHLLQHDFCGEVNIASGVPIPLREVMDQIGALMRQPELIHAGALPLRAGDPLVVAPDTTRLNTIINWQPSYSLKQGLTETIAWWQTYQDQA